MSFVAHSMSISATQCFLHRNICKNGTLTHKDLKTGHSDLVLGVIGSGHLRCLEIWNELSSSFNVNFCHLHRNACKNGTLTHKDLKIGHSDLVLGVIGSGHLRFLETWNKLCS